MNEYFNAKHPPEQDEQVAVSIKKLLKELAKVNISHGDLKATNILLTEDNKPLLLDLDAMQLHRCSWLARRTVKRDWQRFLRNWSGRPKVLKLFE